MKYLLSDFAGKYLENIGTIKIAFWENDGQCMKKASTSCELASSIKSEYYEWNIDYPIIIKTIIDL